MCLELHNTIANNIHSYERGGFEMGIDYDISIEPDRPDNGFLFKSYKGGHVSNSKMLTYDDLLQIDTRHMNSQNLVAECEQCGALMNYVNHNPEDIDSGWYICPVCGKRLREMTLYTQLDKENERWLRAYPECNEDYVEDDSAWLEDL